MTMCGICGNAGGGMPTSGRCWRKRAAAARRCSFGPHALWPLIAFPRPSQFADTVSRLTVQGQGHLTMGSEHTRRRLGRCPITYPTGQPFSFRKPIETGTSIRRNQLNLYFPILCCCCCLLVGVFEKKCPFGLVRWDFFWCNMHIAIFFPRMHIVYCNMNMGMQYGYFLLKKKDIDSKTILHENLCNGVVHA